MNLARILIVEDEQVLAWELSEELERAGYSVVGVVASGEEAIEKVRLVQPDVAVIDIRLAGEMDGIETATVLRSDMGIPTVHLTALDDPDMIERAKLNEPFAYLIKPCSGTALRAAIEIALCKADSERRLKKANDELERRVQERTAELLQANTELRSEIAEKTKIQAALIASEERFRAIFESTPDCIYIKDKDLKYTLVNPAMEAVLRRPTDRIIGHEDKDIFDGSAAEHLKRVDQRVLNGATIEEEHTRSINGAPVSFLDIKTPLYTKDGYIAGICGISRNVSGRVQPIDLSFETVDAYASETMRSALSLALLAAQSNCITLITGESGSGKDFLARFIHRNSGKAGGPYLSVNCAAIPSGLAESELFGHEPGAFTGARQRRRGRIEIAEGGTLLLNEIGELPLDIQAKLLSFLDTMSFTRVGGEKAICSDIRLLAATNRNLEEEVSAGRFREDLFHRLNVFLVHVPPLRKRLEDIPGIVSQLLDKLATDMQLQEKPAIHHDAMELLLSYDWPGNVRELRNVLERALILSRGGTLIPECMQLQRPRLEKTERPSAMPPDMTLPEFLADIERRIMEETLSRTDGNKRAAAQLLGISRFTLARRMNRVGTNEQ